MKRTRVIGTTALLSAIASSLAGAQKEPRRPELPAGADTNDAQAYFDLGQQQLNRNPEQAADAFYWSSRLQPTWADAFYARRVALLLTDRRRLVRYWQGDKRTIQSNDVRRIDSLYLHALALNPFVSERLDGALLDGVITQIVNDADASGTGDVGNVRYEIETYLMHAPAAMRAWRAYTFGSFDDALKLYAEAIRQTKKNATLRIERGRLFFRLNQPDSALAEFSAALDELRKRDKKDLIYVYESKALLEQSLAAIYQRLDKRDLAREALGRALQEDLSFYSAHVQLGYLALDAKDTATALSEMDLATQLRADDPAIGYIYGFALASAGRNDDAEKQLRHAADLDPVYAAPHYALGKVYEQMKRPADAVREYRSFLALAAKVDNRRDEITSRLAAVAPSTQQQQ